MKKQQMVSVADFERHLALAYSTRNYFVFRECYLDLMGRDEALVLQKLMNRQEYFYHKYGSLLPFVCSVRQLDYSLRMNKNTQNRILSSLRKKGFISLSWGGMPYKRRVIVNYVALSKALDKSLWGVGAELHDGSAKRHDSVPVNRHDSKAAYKIQGKHKVAVRSAHATESFFEVDEQIDPKIKPIHYWLATVLKDGIKERKPDRIDCHSKIENWAKQFQLIDDQDKRNQDRTIKLVHWYITHIDDEYMPHIFSGEAFREKYGKLSAAYDKDQKPEEQGERVVVRVRE